MNITDAQIEQTWNSMPDGPDGFRKSWGYLQFARAILDLREHPPQRMHPSLPREHRTSQAPGFAMIAPTDWIETTPRWHERCEAYQRASDYIAQIVESIDGVHQVMIVRDFCEWIEHQHQSHIIETIGNVLAMLRMAGEPIAIFKSRIVLHVQARYA